MYIKILLQYNNTLIISKTNMGHKLLFQTTQKIFYAKNKTIKEASSVKIKNKKMENNKMMNTEMVIKLIKKMVIKIIQNLMLVMCFRKNNLLISNKKMLEICFRDLWNNNNLKIVCRLNQIEEFLLLKDNNKFRKLNKLKIK